MRTLGADRAQTRDVGLPSPGLRRLAAPLGIFACSRAALGLVLFFALKLPTAGGASRFLAYWDGAWYLEVARHGYPNALVPAPGQSDHAFFPLYPLAIRAFHGLTGLSWVTSALAVNLVASGLAMAVIYVLIERLMDAPAALRTVTLLCFFPWAFIFSMAYSEGILLLASAICLLALLDERWVVAGLAALAAGASRPTGFVLFLPCAWAAAAAFRRTRSIRPFVAPLLAPWGVIGFFAFLQWRTGDFLANLHARDRGWSSQGFGFQSSQVGKVLSTYLAHPLMDLDRTASFATLALVVVCIVLMARWRPPMIIWLYTVSTLALAAYFQTYSSTPRFALTAFPLFAPLARSLRDVPFWLVIGTSAMLMAVLFCLIGTTTWLVP
ncbi:MAG: hypothetical protein QOJ93_1112 [Actinomycetota bacterium]|nr:hypothetical protein [Actinomycetota bacterium]